MSMELMVKAMKIKVGNPLRKLVLLKLADNANDHGECWPSYQHIADQCEIDRSTVRKHIKQLEVQGLLRIENRLGPLGNSSNLYTLILDGVGQKPTPVGQERTPVGIQPIGGVGLERTRTSHSLEPVNEPLKANGAEAPADANATAAPAKVASPKFNASKELLALGVEKQVVDDWLAIRKAKRQTLTLTALEQTKREAEKAGVTLNDAIKFSVQNSWAGFKATWMQNATFENLKQPAITRHTGFDQRDYTDGLIPNGDGSYSF
ncbi:MAG: helix-turn-helix domain-containing protein [Pseudomonas sp.]